MAKTKYLTDTQIKALRGGEKDRKISFGDGLFLLVQKNGVKRWLFRYQFDGKEKMISFGDYVSIREGRIKGGEAHTLLSAGIDPSQARKNAKAQKIERTANTFQVVATEWLAGYKENVVEHTYISTKSRLERHVFPALGEIPIANVDSDLVLTVLKEMRKKLYRGKQIGADVKRAGVNISQVMNYAIVKKLALYDPWPAASKQLNRPKGGHHASIINPVEFGRLLRSIDQFKGHGPAVVAALKLLPLLFVRKIELRFARWKDIDFEKTKWTYLITKTGTEHHVPLSRQAVEILRELAQFTRPAGELKDSLVFPGERQRSHEQRPFSETLLNDSLRDLGYTNNMMTIHGFRASARTMLAEILEYPGEIVEHQLGHGVKDSNGTAYNRTKFLRQRTAMMQAWADYLDGLKAGPQPSPVSLPLEVPVNGPSEPQDEADDPFWYLPYNTTLPVA